MAGLFVMPPTETLHTYQDLAPRFKVNARTVQRWWRYLPKFHPTRNTVRIRESDVKLFEQNKLSPDTRPDAQPDGVKRTKRPVSS